MGAVCSISSAVLSALALIYAYDGSKPLSGALLIAAAFLAGIAVGNLMRSR